jgi:hypothetical protein
VRGSIDVGAASRAARRTLAALSRLAIKACSVVRLRLPADHGLSPSNSCALRIGASCRTARSAIAFAVKQASSDAWVHLRPSTTHRCSAALALMDRV